jgi:putative endonuclease
VADGRTLVFVEVKTRCSGSGSPFDAIDARKRGRVRRMAREWLLQGSRPRRPDLRFDAVGITLDPRGELVRLEQIEAAF